MYKVCPRLLRYTLEIIKLFVVSRPKKKQKKNNLPTKMRRSVTSDKNAKELEARMLTYFFFNLFMKENKRKGMEALGSKKGPKGFQ